MQYKSLIQTLINIGLRENQALVYIALLQLGTGSVHTISKKSMIPRSSCESILMSLKEKRFITSYKKKNILHFNAEDPKKIIADYEQRTNELKVVLPDLQILYKQRDNSPSVRSYEGISGINGIFNEVLDDADSVFYFGSADDLFSTIPPKDMEKFIQERLRRKIPVKIILKDSAVGRERLNIAHKILADGKTFPSIYNCNGIIFVWKNKIALFSLRSDVAGFVIESKELAELVETSLKIIWDMLPYPKNS